MSAEGAGGTRPAEIVAGFLAAMSIAACVIGLAWHPLRLIGPGIVLALVAAGIGGRYSRLAFAAVMIAAVCLFLGLMISVLAERPLY